MLKCTIHASWLVTVMYWFQNFQLFKMISLAKTSLPRYSIYGQKAGIWIRKLKFCKHVYTIKANNTYLLKCSSSKRIQVIDYVNDSVLTLRKIICHTNMVRDHWHLQFTMVQINMFLLRCISVRVDLKKHVCFRNLSNMPQDLIHFICFKFLDEIIT